MVHVLTLGDTPIPSGPCVYRVFRVNSALTCLLLQLTLSSSINKNKPIYKLKIRYELPQTGKRAIDDQTIQGSFTDWFNVHGYLDKKAFRRWLAGNLEVVGHADPEAKKEWDDAIEEQRVDEEVVSEGAIRSGAERTNATVDGSAKKRGRPKKVGM